MKLKLKKPALNFGWIKNIRSDALWAILAYLHVLILLPIIFKSRDSFVQYHIKQGAALLFIWILFSFSFFFPILPWIFAVLILVFLMAGLINVILGKKRPLPIIGKIAERF